MSDKTKREPKQYALSSAVHARLALAITTAGDARGQVLTFKQSLLETVGKVASLRGKKLPPADADAIAMETARLYAERGYDADSIKVKKSQAKKLATCAPVLVQAFERKIPGLTDGLAPVLRFCTALGRADYHIPAAVTEFTRQRKVNKAASIAQHVKAILGMESAIKACSAAAKRDLRAWAEKYGINVKTAEKTKAKSE